MLGIVVAVILSLTAETTALVAGVALHTSFQTKHFVEHWHKDSHELWVHQGDINSRDIDGRLQTEDALKQSASWLGQKYLSVQQQHS